MNFVHGMLKAPIHWRVTLRRKSSASKAGQDARRKVEDVIASDQSTAKALALQKFDNAKYFEVESVREAR